jgi:hypothetical protein
MKFMMNVFAVFLTASFSLFVACDDGTPSQPDTTTVPDVTTTPDVTSDQPDTTTVPDTTTTPDDVTPSDPCEQYEWLVVDEHGDTIKWECTAYNGDVDLHLEERDGVCYLVSEIFEKPAGEFTLEPPNRFVEKDVPEPFTPAECVPIE